MLNIPEENLENIKGFNLFDDLYMSVFFEDNIEGTEFVLRMILEKNDLEVESVKSQEVVLTLVSKGSRLDVVAKDKKGNRYNIEFQVVLDKNLKQRGRFYLSNADIASINRGEQYDKLRDSYVIFICRGDALGKKKPLYHFTMKDENGDDLNIGQHLIFIDADYQDEWRLEELMHDFKCTDPNQMRYNVLKRRAKYFKEKEGGIMYLNANMQSWADKREAAIRAETRAETLRALLKENLPFDMISRVTKLPIDEIEKMQKNMNEEKPEK